MQAASDGADDARRRRLLVLGMCGALFFALLVAGLGILSLLTDRDVVSADGLGPATGILGVLAALGAWTGVLGPALARRPGVGIALLAGLAAAAAYVLAVFVVAFFATADALASWVVAARLVTEGFAPVIAVAGLLAATAAAVAVRTTPGAARWPWENDEPE